MTLSLLSITLHAQNVPYENRYRPDAVHERKEMPLIQSRELSNKAQQRRFQTQQAYEQMHRNHAKSRQTASALSEYAYDDQRSHLSPKLPRTKGYAHSKKSWEHTYRYKRADFYDRYGYHYGYFNRQGYYFEGVFYHYDRFYTYHDRIQGRGLFERKYYRPLVACNHPMERAYDTHPIGRY